MKTWTVAVLLLAIPLGLLARWARQETRAAQTREAVRTVAQSVNRLYLENPTPTREGLDRCIFRLQEAGVTSIMAGPDGRPADPYRTPLRIHHEFQGRQSITTVTSAGADRQFSTADDVSYTESAPVPDRH